MTKDSVTVVMGAPDVPRKAYLMGGQYIEILVFRSDGKTGPADALPRKTLLPLVIVDGALTGWGWEHLDSVAGRHNIPVDPAQ
jgi:hypothetical protein